MPTINLGKLTSSELIELANDIANEIESRLMLLELDNAIKDYKTAQMQAHKDDSNA